MLINSGIKQKIILTTLFTIATQKKTQPTYQLNQQSKAINNQKQSTIEKQMRSISHNIQTKAKSFFRPKL